MERYICIYSDITTDRYDSSLVIETRVSDSMISIIDNIIGCSIIRTIAREECDLLSETIDDIHTIL